MKVLHIALNDQGLRQEALCRALRSMGEYYEFDWIEEKKKGLANMRKELIRVCQLYKPDFIFMQIQAPDIIDPETIRKMKEGWAE
jgi:hypothetical protein